MKLPSSYLMGDEEDLDLQRSPIPTRIPFIPDSKQIQQIEDDIKPVLPNKKFSIFHMDNSDVEEDNDMKGKTKEKPNSQLPIENKTNSVLHNSPDINKNNIQELYMENDIKSPPHNEDREEMKYREFQSAELPQKWNSQSPNMEDADRMKSPSYSQRLSDYHRNTYEDDLKIGGKRPSYWNSRDSSYKDDNYRGRGRGRGRGFMHSGYRRTNEWQENKWSSEDNVSPRTFAMLKAEFPKLDKYQIRKIEQNLDTMDKEYRGIVMRNLCFKEEILLNVPGNIDNDTEITPDPIEYVMFESESHIRYLSEYKTEKCTLNNHTLNCFGFHNNKSDRRRMPIMHSNGIFSYI